MTELTAELIADLKFPRGLQLSPDGRWGRLHPQAAK